MKTDGVAVWRRHRGAGPGGETSASSKVHSSPSKINVGTGTAATAAVTVREPGGVVAPGAAHQPAPESAATTASNVIGRPRQARSRPCGQIGHEGGRGGAGGTIPWP